MGLVPACLSRRRNPAADRSTEQVGRKQWQTPRFVPGENIERWIPEALQTLPLQEAPVTYEVARETGRLRLPHRDPTDRLLLATAKVSELTLITADEHLLKTRDVAILANH